MVLIFSSEDEFRKCDPAFKWKLLSRTSRSCCLLSKVRSPGQWPCIFPVVVLIIHSVQGVWNRFESGDNINLHSSEIFETTYKYFHSHQWIQLNENSTTWMLTGIQLLSCILARRSNFPRLSLKRQRQRTHLAVIESSRLKKKNLKYLLPIRRQRVHRLTVIKISHSHRWSLKTLSSDFTLSYLVTSPFPHVSKTLSFS